MRYRQVLCSTRLVHLSVRGKIPTLVILRNRVACKYIECEQMAKARTGRKRRTEAVKLQRRQIPCAQQNGQSYSLVTRLLFRVLA